MQEHAERASEVRRTCFFKKVLKSSIAFWYNCTLVLKYQTHHKMRDLTTAWGRRRHYSFRVTDGETKAQS